MKDETREDEIGALWIKSGRGGEFMSGEVNGQPVVVFRNDRKQPNSKAPDWRVLKARPKPATDEVPF